MRPEGLAHPWGQGGDGGRATSGVWSSFCDTPPPRLGTLGDVVALCPFCSIFLVVPRLPPRRLFWGRKVAFRRWWGGQGELRPPGLTDGACLGQGTGGQSGSPAPSLAPVPPPQHPGVPPDALGRAQRRPAQDLPLQGYSETPHPAAVGRRRPPKAAPPHPPPPRQAGVCRLSGGRRCRSRFPPSFWSSGFCTDGRGKKTQPNTQVAAAARRSSRYLGSAG